MKKYSQIVRYINQQPWAILDGTLDAIIEVVERRLIGEPFTADEVRERIAAFERERGAQFKSAGVAVIPMVGVISHRINMMSEISGGVSTQGFAKTFRKALADPEVKAIVFDVDSPGGGVDGVPELAKEIRDSRGQKPIVAVANSLMASAAFWLSAGADEVVASPSADVGSVGVIARHIDFSKQREMMGVKVTHITDGKFKNEFSPDQPLTSESIEHLQNRVNEVGDEFRRAVADGRKVSLKRVREEFGQGRVLSAKQALDVGMVDRIETLEQTVDRLLASNGKSRRKSAELDGQNVPSAETEPNEPQEHVEEKNSLEPAANTDGADPKEELQTTQDDEAEELAVMLEKQKLRDRMAKTFS